MAYDITKRLEDGFTFVYVSGNLLFGRGGQRVEPVAADWSLGGDVLSRFAAAVAAEFLRHLRFDADRSDARDLWRPALLRFKVRRRMWNRGPSLASLFKEQSHDLEAAKQPPRQAGKARESTFLQPVFGSLLGEWPVPFAHA